LRITCLMRHILCWSGGEDSTATAILAHIHGLPLDTIIFSEVMFDKWRGISGEHPLHIDFVKNVAKPVFEKWGYEVLILHAERDYLDCFHRVIDRPVKHIEHKGKKYGFAISRQCSIKRDCKVKPIQEYFKSIQHDEYLQYVGICANEKVRLMSLEKQKNAISLLEEFGYTKEMTGPLCSEYGLRSPLYELPGQKRQGCWMCPNSRLEEHRLIKETMPDIWREYVNLEKEDVAFNKWNVYTEETLEQRDTRIIV